MQNSWIPIQGERELGSMQNKPRLDIGYIITNSDLEDSWAAGRLPLQERSGRFVRCRGSGQKVDKNSDKSRKLEVPEEDHRMPIVMTGNWQRQVCFVPSKTRFYSDQWPLLELRDGADKPVPVDRERLERVLDEHFIFYEPLIEVDPAGE